jgi:streptogramin lyase
MNLRRLLLTPLIWALIGFAAMPASAATWPAGAARPQLHRLPDATHAGQIAFAPDGKLWLVGSHGSEFPGGESEFVGRWDPVAGLTEFKLPQGREALGDPAVAPDGDYLLPGWSSREGPEPSVGRINRVSPTGRSQEYTLEDRFSGVSALVASGEGAWVAAYGGSSEDGQPTVFSIDGAGNLNGPTFQLEAGCVVSAMAAGPDGTIWFTEGCWRDPSRLVGHRASINEIDAAGTLIRHPIASSFEPLSLAIGADGSAWFGEVRVPGFVGGRIGHLDTGGRVDEFPLTGVGWPDSIAVGPEGRLWFPAFSSTAGLEPRALASIGPGGKIGRRICVARKCGLVPGRLTTGPDGDIWFTVSGPTASGGGGGTGLLEMARVANEAGFIGRLRPD